MMMMNSSGRNPFTVSQWQELEQQALVFKYMVSGIPVPPDLLFTIRRSFDISSNKFLSHHQPQQHNIGWNSMSFHEMGFGMMRKIDPEPGRCRRTDGKKWRCSKEAYPDSKYCERHMHRGRNRSRKPVENNNTISMEENSSSNILSHHNKNNSCLSVISSHHSFLSPASHSEPQFLSPPREENTTSCFFLQPNAHSHPEPTKDCSLFGHGTKREISDVPLNNTSEREQHYLYQPSKKVMHHFLDEWSQPLTKDDDHYSWPNNSFHDQHDHTTTQLSISVPNSLHDFFMTQK
ncbi:hypothetical protein OROHE_009160 [Orobanche hederae]